MISVEVAIALISACQLIGGRAFGRLVSEYRDSRPGLAAGLRLTGTTGFTAAGALSAWTATTLASSPTLAAVGAGVATLATMASAYSITATSQAASVTRHHSGPIPDRAIPAPDVPSDMDPSTNRTNVTEPPPPAGDSAEHLAATRVSTAGHPVRTSPQHTSSTAFDATAPVLDPTPSTDVGPAV